MFATMSQAMKGRMKELENMDRQQRADGVERRYRLRQIPPETGQFLAILAATAPVGQYLEIGTSGGYSTMWLSLAAEATNRKVITFELDDNKVVLAQETFRRAEVESWVDLRPGDARAVLPDLTEVALDAEKEIYADCYEIVVSHLVPGGLLVADNAINHRETLEPMLEHALNDPRVDALIVPIGTGVLVCRKV